MTRSFFMMLTAGVCGAVFAADGTWKDGSAGGSWSDASRWVDGVLPDDGGIANLSFTKPPLHVDATGVTATLGGIDFRSALDANQQVTLANGTFTLVPPARISVAKGSLALNENQLTNDGDTLFCGAERIILMAPQNLSGRAIISNAYLRVSGDTALGTSPSTLWTDAIVLDNGTLQNAVNFVNLSPNRGITLTERGGFLMAGYNMPARLTIAAPITGPGALGINYENSPVYLANPANDYVGDTSVGTHGPGWNAASQAFALHLAANEVIPHGAGKGRLNIGLETTFYNSLPYMKFEQNPNAYLNLDGHVETVNALTAGPRAYVASTNVAGRLILASNEDSDFRGTLCAGATLEKRGSGTLKTYGGVIEGDIELKEGTLETGGENISSGRVTLMGGAMRIVPPSGCQYWYASSEAGTEQWLGWKRWPEAGRTALNLNAHARARYRCRWRVPEDGTYSFLKSYSGLAELWIDGDLIVSNLAANAAATVVPNKTLAAGWHDVELLFYRHREDAWLEQSTFYNGIMYDPQNGSFDSASWDEAKRARMFSDDGGPDVRATGYPFQYLGCLNVASDAAVEVTAEAEPFIFAGRLTGDPEDTHALTITSASGNPIFFGGASAQTSALLGEGVSLTCPGGIVYTNFVTFKTAPAPNAVIAPGATVTYDYPGALDNGLTLTDMDLRITSNGTGDGTLVVPTGRKVIFDTQSLVDGSFVDSSSGVRSYANAVVLEGGTLEFTGAGTMTFAGAVSGSGTILKTGAGDVIFSDGTALSADTIVEIKDGTFHLSASGSLGAATVKVSEGRFGNVEGENLTFANPIIANAGGFTTLGTNATMTLSGTITQWQNVSKWGDGTLRLTGSEPNNVQMHVRGGTLVLAKDDNVTAVGYIIGCEAGCTLRLEGEGQIASDRGVSLDGGTFDLNGHDITLQQVLTRAPGSTIINNGASPATLVCTTDEDQSFTGTLADGTAPLTLVCAGAAHWDFTQATIANSGLTATNGVVAFAGPECITGSLLRFTANKSRPGTGGVPQYAGSGIQFSELRVTLNGETVPWPTGTTSVAAGPGATSKESAAMLIDGDTATKWYYGGGINSPVTIDCGTDISFDAYQFATANDAIGRDPVSWTFEVGMVAGGVTNWMVIDRKVDVSNEVTTARSTWNDPINLKRTHRFSVFPADYALTVQRPAVAVFGWLDQMFANLSGDGTLEFTDGAQGRLTDGSTFCGNVSSEEPFVLAYSTETVPAITAPDAATIIRNDGAAATMAFAPGSFAHLGVWSDGAAALGVNIPSTSTVVVWNADNAYTGATTVDGALNLATGFLARHFRFTIRNCTAGAGSKNAQISEIQLMAGGVYQPWPDGTLAKTTGSSDGKGEGPLQLLDGQPSTKCYWNSDVYPVVITLPETIAFNGYRWYTANDSMTTRNPTSWDFEYSLDGVNWTMFDSQTNKTTVSTTCTLAYTQVNDMPDATVATSGLAGNGVVQVASGSTARLLVGSDAAFSGAVNGAGTLVKAGEAKQTLSGTVALTGTLIVELGELDLTGATLTGVTNIVLRGGVLTGTASVQGDLTVVSEGGAYGASLNVDGKLTLVGEPVIQSGFSGQAVRGRAFAYASTDAASQALFLSATCVETPGGSWKFAAQASATEMRWSVAPGGTTFYLR